MLKMLTPTYLLLQLSTVCRAFADALEASDLLKQTLHTHGCGGKGTQACRLDSRLILQWAGHCTGLDLFSQLCEMPGARQLVVAAPNMTYVAVHCRSMLQAAQAGCLLTRLSSVQYLLLHGEFYPSMLPLSVGELEVRPCYGHERYAPVAWFGDQADGIVYKAERLPLLRVLRLYFPDLGPKPATCSLTCPMHFGSLEQLHLELSLAGHTLDLSWVRLQTHLKGLHLQIRIYTKDPVHHQHCVQQLSGLQVTTLELFLSTPFPAPLQLLWSSLDISRLQLSLQGCRTFSGC